MNTKQLLAVMALTASATASLEASAQYATDGFMAPTKAELVEAYRAKDLVKINNLKIGIIELNKEIIRLELQEYGQK